MAATRLATRHAVSGGVGAKRRSVCQVGVWNIRGSMDEKTNELCKIMEERRIDILGLCETKKKESGMIRINGMIEVWSGVKHSEHASKGVAVLIAPRMAECMKGFENVSPRLLWIRFKAGLQKLLLVVGYGPCNDEETRKRRNFGMM